MTVTLYSMDLETGVVMDTLLGRTAFQEGSFPVISDDGKSILTFTKEAEDAGNQATGIVCWDVPAKRRWEWIIGLPAALALPVLAWRSLRAWRRKRRDVLASPVAS